MLMYMAAWTLFAGIGLLWLLIVIASLALMIWAILDIVKAKNKDNFKVIWILVVVLLGLIGIIIYYFVGRKERKL